MSLIPFLPSYSITQVHSKCGLFPALSKSEINAVKSIGIRILVVDCLKRARWVEHIVPNVSSTHAGPNAALAEVEDETN